MLSRRDKLLRRPWEQKHYENHLRKIHSALPAIDNRPPASRNHVALKLKKRQREDERITKIEKENLILLQKLNYIMRTNRVDNWITPQPNFLNRVSIFQTSSKKETKTERPQDLINESDKITVTRCLACTPQKNTKSMEQISWEPEKQPLKRVRSKSVPIKKIRFSSNIKTSYNNSSTTVNEIKPAQKKTEQINNGKTHKQENSKKHEDIKSPQSIILSRGSLVLAVNFPSDTFVKLQEGNTEKQLMRGLCQCKTISKNVC